MKRAGATSNGWAHVAQAHGQAHVLASMKPQVAALNKATLHTHTHVGLTRFEIRWYRPCVAAFSRPWTNPFVCVAFREPYHRLTGRGGPASEWLPRHVVVHMLDRHMLHRFCDMSPTVVCSVAPLPHVRCGFDACQHMVLCMCLCKFCPTTCV